MLERNESCPCGSGLKYKKCYVLKLEHCNLYQNEKFTELKSACAEMEAKVLKFFQEVGEEIVTVFSKDSNDQELVSIRVQAVSVFTLIDVLASYWFCYLNKTGKPSERFISWVTEFCFSDKNQIYKKGVLSRVQPAELYELRCTLVHFMGIGGKGDKGIALVPDDANLVALVEPYLRRAKNKGRIINLVKPKDLFELVLEAAQLMMLEWVEIKSRGERDLLIEKGHILGIARIYEKIKSEGAHRVYSR